MMENKREIDPDIKEQMIKKIPEHVFDKLGPKSLFRMDAFLDMSGGWRSGYTQPTIDDRRLERRKKNKLARKKRRISRQKG